MARRPRRRPERLGKHVGVFRKGAVFNRLIKAREKMKDKNLKSSPTPRAEKGAQGAADP
jgi:hypothetical protein